MMKQIFALGLLAALPLLSGCGGQHVPAKMEVKDISSGKVYTTYSDLAKEEKGVGYRLLDADTGAVVTLTSYEVKQIAPALTVDPKSPEATEYLAAKAKKPAEK